MAGDALQIVGALLTLAGAVFLFLGALGIVRMPDVYNRIQTGTKAATLGVMLTLVGLGLYEIAWLPKLLVIAAFVLVTSPVSGHALARAAHKAHSTLAVGTVADALASRGAADGAEAEEEAEDAAETAEDRGRKEDEA